ncbi:MAG: hypothetical protein HOH18_08905 [Kordiimonadaceae bacterium]|nr:hypothetical protein [Kordiimonadaceae bacterium]
MMILSNPAKCESRFSENWRVSMAAFLTPAASTRNALPMVGIWQMILETDHSTDTIIA